jgi:uncharacterized membrane protein (DUF106 family)
MIFIIIIFKKSVIYPLTGLVLLFSLQRQQCSFVICNTTIPIIWGRIIDFYNIYNMKREVLKNIQRRLQTTSPAHKARSRENEKCKPDYDIFL